MKQLVLTIGAGSLYGTKEQYIFGDKDAATLLFDALKNAKRIVTEFIDNKSILVAKDDPAFSLSFQEVMTADEFNYQKVESLLQKQEDGFLNEMETAVAEICPSQGLIEI